MYTIIVVIILYLIDYSGFESFPYYVIMTPIIITFINRIIVLVICNFITIEQYIILRDIQRYKS